MPIKVPFDVIEAMILAVNNGIHSGSLAHEIVQATIGSANRLGWVLQSLPGQVNLDMPASDENEVSPKSHMMVSAETFMDFLNAGLPKS